MSDWNTRRAYGGEWTEQGRAAFAALLNRRDSLPTLPTTSRLTRCPCAVHGGEYDCGNVEKLPAHSTCDSTNGPGLCWTWSGCDDPDCDHPACGTRGWYEFRKAWIEQHGEESSRIGDGLVLWASPWVPWIEHGRHAELFGDGTGHDADPSKLLRALERKGAVYPVLIGETYLEQELALAARGLPLEARKVAETSPMHLAYAVAQGAADIEESGGGTIIEELRLAAALDLADAPDGYQGALFA